MRERRPQAIAVLDDLYYVDRSGATFGPLRPSDSRDYPVITGLDADAAGGPAQLGAAPRPAAAAPLRARARASCGELSEVHVDADARRGRLPGGAARADRARLGQLAGEARARRARAARAGSGGAERLAQLDVRFRNQVVVTLRPAAGAAAPPPAHGAAATARGLKA